MRILLLFFPLAATLWFASSTSARENPEISSALLDKYKIESNINILITMRDRPSTALSKVSTQSFTTRGARITSLYNSLQSHAAQTQREVLQLISDQAPTLLVKTFWISNQIYVEGAPLGLVQLLANSSSSILLIEEEWTIKLSPPPMTTTNPVEEYEEIKNPESAQWGVLMVRAPQVWESPEFGTNGTGVTVGIIDSGVRGTHNLLRPNYKNDGHSWFDPYDGSLAPRDGKGHGTHCAGSILGQQGIGVAPGAEWIACKGLDDSGQGSASALLHCCEFMLCPTDVNGNNQECNLAPRIVSNSWGGGQGVSGWIEVINAWKEANIIPVFAIGNDGEGGCSTAGSPGDQPDVISVGATTISDSLAYFSSLGPSVEGLRKPEITAPGHYIWSANHTNDETLAIKSGTSMATPHVAGVIALLLSYKPHLSFSDVKEIIEHTADQDLTFVHKEQVCGDHRIDIFPNNHFGWGRINAYRAMKEARHYNSHGNVFRSPCTMPIITSLVVFIAYLVKNLLLIEF